MLKVSPMCLFSSKPRERNLQSSRQMFVCVCCVCVCVRAHYFNKPHFASRDCYIKRIVDGPRLCC